VELEFDRLPEAQMLQRAKAFHQEMEQRRSENDEFGGSQPDTGTLTVVAGPSDGTTSTAGDNIKYTPDNGFVGTDSFVYRICSVAGSCDQAPWSSP